MVEHGITPKDNDSVVSVLSWEAVRAHRLKSLAKLKPERAFLVPDEGGVRELNARVLTGGGVSLVLLKRFPRNPKNPVPVALGETELGPARERARQWLTLIKKGIDPRDEEDRRRREQAEKRANTFSSVCADYIATKLPGERRGAAARDVPNVLLPEWGERPITEITRADGVRLIKAIRSRTRTGAYAKNIYGLARRILQWAVDQECYGLEESPLQHLQARKLIGKLPVGSRIFTDAEWFAFMRAVRRMRYPYGPAYQLLALSALRLNEVADASWREFDLAAGVWVIPASRMKGKNDDARAHAVPITPEIRALLSELPRFKGGQYVFTTTAGVKSVWMRSKVKRDVDKRMLRTLRAMARRRGEDPAAIELPAWTNHDIRRSVRSRLSRLKISENAREAVLAHKRPGIAGVYDHYDYLDEKREALELWAKALRDIIEPPPSNVITLQAAGGRS
jgi:integrase